VAVRADLGEERARARPGGGERGRAHRGARAGSGARRLRERDRAPPRRPHVDTGRAIPVSLRRRDRAQRVCLSGRVRLRLVAPTSPPGAPYRFHVADETEPNAFALPGGFVYVTRGLLALANSEDELAGLMC